MLNRLFPREPQCSIVGYSEAMEFNLLGSKGYYTVRNSADAFKENGPTLRKSIATSHAKIVILAVGFGLICTPYFVLSSLATSLQEEIGSFSLAALYFGWLLSLFVTPSVVNILGAKTCAILSGFCTLIFAVSYFHPSWYTLIPSSLSMGIGYGLLYTAAGTIKNDEVQKCVEHWKVNSMTYHGRFSSIIVSFGLGASALVSGVISIAILSSSDRHSKTQVNYILQNVTTQNASNSTELVVSAKVYYTLVATLATTALFSILTLSIMRGAAYHQCSVCSFGLKEVLCNMCTRAVMVLKQVATPAYVLMLPLQLNQGFTSAYFFGVFTKTYVTDCVGVGIVGASVIVWGTFATLSSFGSGWLMRFTTSYVMVLVCIGGLEAGSVIFLIVWERQPSFVVIFTMASIFGLCYGLNATVALAYSGTAPGDNVIGYNAFIMETSVANATQYLVSVYISAEENLYLILVITILAVSLFTIADVYYGSGTSRNICGKKKPVVVANKHTELVISSSKEKGGVENKVRRESAIPLCEDKSASVNV